MQSSLFWRRRLHCQCNFSLKRGATPKCFSALKTPFFLPRRIGGSWGMPGRIFLIQRFVFRGGHIWWRRTLFLSRIWESFFWLLLIYLILFFFIFFFFFLIFLIFFIFFFIFLWFRFLRFWFYNLKILLNPLTKKIMFFLFSRFHYFWINSGKITLRAFGPLFFRGFPRDYNRRYLLCTLNFSIFSIFYRYNCRTFLTLSPNFIFFFF